RSSALEDVCRWISDAPESRVASVPESSGSEVICDGLIHKIWHRWHDTCHHTTGRAGELITSTENRPYCEPPVPSEEQNKHCSGCNPHDSCQARHIELGS